MAGLQPGERAPGFTLADAAGREVSFTPEKLKRDTVVVFYPGHFSAPAHQFLHEVQRRLSQFHDQGAEVLAISTDDPYTAGHTASQEGLFFPLLSDTDRKVIEAYGVPVVRDTVHGVYAQPAMFVVGRDGTVKWSYTSPDALERISAEQLLEQLREVVAKEQGR